MKTRELTARRIDAYVRSLRAEDRAPSTVEKCMIAKYGEKNRKNRTNWLGLVRKAADFSCIRSRSRNRKECSASL